MAGFKVVATRTLVSLLFFICCRCCCCFHFWTKWNGTSGSTDLLVGLGGFLGEQHRLFFGDARLFGQQLGRLLRPAQLLVGLARKKNPKNNQVHSLLFDILSLILFLTITIDCLIIRILFFPFILNLLIEFAWSNLISPTLDGK